MVQFLFYFFGWWCQNLMSCFFVVFFNEAKESWEMNPVEKLEQSCIVKDKGTQYFKVSIFTLSVDFMNEWMSYFLHSSVYFRKVNTSRRRCSTKRLFRGWNMNLGWQKGTKWKQKHCGWLHIWTWPCASSRWRSRIRLWKTVTRYCFYDGHGHY